MAKIIVAGDSIAYGKWDSKGGWVARLRKYIDKEYNLEQRTNFQVHNLGISGEIAPRLSERFENELTMRLPANEKGIPKNLVIIAVGGNDSCPNNSMTMHQTSKENFIAAFQKMYNAATAHTCKVVVVGLTPANPTRSKGLLFTNEEIRKYNKYCVDFCAKHNIPMLNFLEELMALNFPDLLVDSIHPNDKGHEILFTKILTFLQKENLIEYLTTP